MEKFFIMLKDEVSCSRLKEVMTEDYLKYVEKNGYHFNEKAADFCSKLLLNRDETLHRWKTRQVIETFSMLHLEKSEKETWGDITYRANRIYANYYPDIIKSATDCLMASALSTDNEYDGREFVGFVCDLVGRDMRVEWSHLL